ncbi:hypothetical protein U1Q18_023323 [Sarracenia purpurea var. burkii]
MQSEDNNGSPLLGTGQTNSDSRGDGHDGNGSTSIGGRRQRRGSAGVVDKPGGGGVDARRRHGRSLVMVGSPVVEIWPDVAPVVEEDGRRCWRWRERGCAGDGAWLG